MQLLHVGRVLVASLLAAALAAQTPVTTSLTSATATGTPHANVKVDVGVPAGTTATLGFSIVHNGVTYFSEVQPNAGGNGQAFGVIFAGMPTGQVPKAGDVVTALVVCSNGTTAQSSKTL